MKPILPLFLLLLAGCVPYTTRIQKLSLPELNLEYQYQARRAGIGQQRNWEVLIGGAVGDRADAQRRFHNLEKEYLRRQMAGDTNAVPPTIPTTQAPSGVRF